jgi:hypothetical protein
MFIPDSYKMKLTPWTTWWFIIMWRDDVESILFTYLNFSASYHTTSLDFFYRYKALQDLDTYYYDWSNQTVPATKLIQLWNKFGSEAPNLPDITDIMDLLDYLDFLRRRISGPFFLSLLFAHSQVIISWEKTNDDIFTHSLVLMKKSCNLMTFSRWLESVGMKERGKRNHKFRT